jgi:hypothetical protein
MARGVDTTTVENNLATIETARETTQSSQHIAPI